MIGFVDDTRKFNNQNTRADTLEDNVILDLQQWKKSTSLIAGKLNLTKCASYILTWEYNKKGYLQMNTNIEHGIKIQDDDGTIKTIPSLSANEAYQYLGITTAPNGNRIDAKKRIHTLCSQFRMSMFRAPITHEEAYIALNVFFMPKITYQLPCYYLHQNEMGNMQKIIEPVTISKIGFNNRWEKALRYGNHDMGSLMIPHLHLEQTIQKLQFLIRAMKNAKTTQLINNVLDIYQLQLGVAHDIFKHPKAHQYTDSSWVSELVIAMSQYNIQLHRDHPTTFPPQRENDSHIMQLITQNIRNVAEQKHLNTCRQYLKVITVSDITTPCGCRLDDQYMSHRVHDSRYYWPRIERPPPNVWKMWRIALRRILCKDLQTNELKDEFKWGSGFSPRLKYTSVGDLLTPLV